MQPIKSLNGTFEGNGYTISNLTLSGSTQDQAFGLIAQLEGSIRNLQLVDVQVKPEATKTVYGGALAGSISGTGEIYRCSVIDSRIVEGKTASIDLTKAGENSATGGLIGEVAGGAKVTIQDCLNTTGVKSAINAGGLIGNALFAAEITIRNSVVLGDVELTNKNGGGIIGLLGNVPVTANQVYFGGTITGNSNKYGFAYNSAYRLTNKITAKSVYYDSTKNKSASPYNPFKPLVKDSTLDGSIDGKSTEDLKALKLDGFTASDKFDGYPVPSWLTTLDTVKEHTVTVTAVGANKVTLLSKDGATTEMSAGENGVFTASLAEGQYTYTAETSLSRKDTATGTLVVGKVDKAMTITLPNKVADTQITVEGPAEAVLKVYQGTDATGKLMQEKSAENGVYTYALQAGSY